jgi:hypothetical protein
MFGERSVRFALEAEDVDNNIRTQGQRPCVVLTKIAVAEEKRVEQDLGQEKGTIGKNLNNRPLGLRNREHQVDQVFLARRSVRRAV